MIRCWWKKFFILLLFLCMLMPTGAAGEETTEAVEKAKAGIVRIQSVCSAGRKTLETRERTGFLAGEEGSEPYVITIAYKLEFSENDKKRLTRKYQLSENEQLQTSIYMYFRGDEKVVLSDPIGKSDSKNIALLRPQQSLTDKYVLTFSRESVKKNEDVYLLSFPSAVDETGVYSETNVFLGKSRVTNTATDRGTDTEYFLHTVSGNDAILGGPFVDGDGNVVGMLISDSLEEQPESGEKTDQRLALTVGEIKKLMDSYKAKYTLAQKISSIQEAAESSLPMYLGIALCFLAGITIVRSVMFFRATARPKPGGGAVANLLRVSSGETIPVTGKDFLIGSSIDREGYRVGGNPKVSRQHARIIFEKRKYYLEDLNSTNGTQLDGVRLSPGTRAKLHEDAEIRLADELFVFNYH